jgi:ABC-type branched-subunit amino acid transport system substrate-binding protein
MRLIDGLGRLRGGRLAAALTSVLVAVVAVFALVLWLDRPAPIRIAFANSMTGAQSLAGAESLTATRLFVDRLNRAGGVGGRKIELTVFDDRSDPVTARANAEAIGKGPFVAVLGHFFSNASLAASPAYLAARIPAVTGTSLADQLTAQNPYYFRVQATISAEARSIAGYLDEVWRAGSVKLVVADDANGRNFQTGFAEGMAGRAVQAFTFKVDPARRQASLAQAARALAGSGEPDVIVVGAGADTQPLVVEALRRQGLTARIISAANTGNEQLTAAFAAQPEERAHPGFFTANFYVAAPLIFDSTGLEARDFAGAYAAAADGKLPSWIGAGAYDAVHLLGEALRQARVSADAASVLKDRERVRGALAAFSNPAAAPQGLAGPLSFDAQRNMERSIRVGSLQGGAFLTAPEQLVLIADPARVDLAAEQAAGRVVTIGDRSYWRQRVVYTGLDVNQVRRVDVRTGTYDVDFYLWLRYGGDDDAPTAIEFPDLATSGAFDPAKPVESTKQGGLNYRLYRVQGTFRNEFDLRDYPFDHQDLVVRFQSSAQPREQVAYVIDRAGLNLASDAPDAASSPEAYRDLQLWRFKDLRYFVSSFATASTLGKPANFGSTARTEYARFTASIVLERNYSVFIAKTLTPIFLLVLIVFSTLYFPNSLVKEQVTLPVTGVLTSAVLLVAMNSQLPEVGYGVAIEPVFYIFFALCGLTIFSAFVGERLRLHHHDVMADRLNHGVKAVYVLTVLVTLALYWIKYGR